MNLSERLKTCLEYTKGFSNLADIGTDHAYLPIEAVYLGYVDKALAIDNKKGPYLIAKNNILKHNLSHKIKAILSDGLSSIDNNVDVVVISGMGGKLISNILKEHSLKNVKRLVLQANSDSFYIREILKDIGFYIIDELYLAENNKYYEVIVLEKGTKSYTNIEIKYGPVNLKNKPDLFIDNITNQLDYLTTVLPNIKSNEKRIEIKKKIKSLQEVLEWTDLK